MSGKARAKDAVKPEPLFRLKAYHGHTGISVMAAVMPLLDAKMEAERSAKEGFWYGERLIPGHTITAIDLVPAE